MQREETSWNDWCNKVSIPIHLYAAVHYLMTPCYTVLFAPWFWFPWIMIHLCALDCYFQPRHHLHLESTGSSLIWRRRTLPLRTSCQNKTHNTRFLTRIWRIWQLPCQKRNSLHRQLLQLSVRKAHILGGDVWSEWWCRMIKALDALHQVEFEVFLFHNERFQLETSCSLSCSTRVPSLGAGSTPRFVDILTDGH